MPDADRLPPLRKLTKRGGPGAGPPPPAPSATKKLPPSPPGESPGDGEAFSFDELSDEEFEALQVAAEDAAEAGLLPEESPDSSQRLPGAGGDDAGGANEEPRASPGEGEEPADDEGGEPAAPEGPDTLLTLAQSAASEAAGYVDQITKLVDVAQEMRAGKPAKVTAILKQAQKLAEDAQAAADEAEKAYGDGEADPDVKALAVAYAEADEACRAVGELLDDAKVAAGKAPEEGEEAGPEGGGEEGDVKEKSPGKGAARGGKGPKGPKASRWASWAGR